MTTDDPTAPKKLEVNVADSLNLQEGLGLHKSGPGGEAFAVVEPQWKATADSQQGMIATASSQGTPSEGEKDSLPCASRFVRFLRAQGETWWDDPVPGTTKDRPWVDCDAFDRRDPRKKRRLQMQVQRAMIGKERYNEWREGRRVELPTGTTPQAAAVILIEAVENKRENAASDVVFLLDALRLPWLAFGDVVAEFRRLYDASPRKAGFQAIYVVPWHESAVRRLDS